LLRGSRLHGSLGCGTAACARAAILAVLRSQAEHLPEERDWLGEPGSAIPCVWTREAVSGWLGAGWPAASVPRGDHQALALMTAAITRAITGS
jgi:hypothetical protein